jgi:hypothetical protein
VKSNDIKPACYTLIANSEQVIIYALSKKNFLYLPEHLQISFKKELNDYFHKNTFCMEDRENLIHRTNLWYKYRKANELGFQE